jgi:hypothetical protein
MTMHTLRARALVLATAGAIAVSAVTPTFAAPVLSNTAAVKSAVDGNVIDVRWRGRGVGLGIAAGVATGALIAGAASRSYYDPYYYDGYYAAAPGYYGGPAYYNEPAYSGYYAPRYYYRGYGYRGYGSGNCPVDAGYGRLDYSMC